MTSFLGRLVVRAMPQGAPPVAPRLPTRYEAASAFEPDDTPGHVASPPWPGDDAHRGEGSVPQRGDSSAASESASAAPPAPEHHDDEDAAPRASARRAPAAPLDAPASMDGKPRRARPAAGAEPVSAPTVGRVAQRAPEPAHSPSPRTRFAADVPTGRLPVSTLPSDAHSAPGSGPRSIAVAAPAFAVPMHTVTLIAEPGHGEPDDHDADAPAAAPAAPGVLRAETIVTRTVRAAPAFGRDQRDQRDNGARPEPASIHITIGRVEVRAQVATPPVRRAAADAPSAVTLADYLRQRGGRGR